MLSQKEAKNIIGQATGYAKLPGCEINLNWEESASIRFANNGITTSGYTLTQTVSITSTTGDKRRASAVVNELTPDALKAGVEQAEMLAAISRPDPEDVEPLGPQTYPDLMNYDAFTGSARNDVMIPHVRAIIDRAREKQLIAAGFIQRSARAVAVGNKAGLFGYHTVTDAGLSATMRNAGGTSSGWASATSVSLKDIDGATVGRVAADKCLRGAGTKRKLDPGKYTVILEPSGVSDLVDFLGFGMGARQAEQGQSFLSKDGGGTHLNEKLFPDFITLRSDPTNPKLPALPWSGGGGFGGGGGGSASLVPSAKVIWIENGVVKNLSYDRYWAGKAGKAPTPFPTNLVLDGQDNTLDDLIQSTSRGLLITRLWYIRFLQQKTLQLTGLTRDGVFLVENGKVTDPVTNFRWNESPVRVLQNAKKMTRSARALGSEGGSMIAPAMVVEDFNLASVSDAV
jgi:predicted Zn-dependent protease